MASKPKQKEQPEKGEETRYYQRIIVMLMNLGTDTLLKLFKSLIPQGDVSLFLDSMFNEVEKLKTSKKISAAEYNRISKRPLVGTELDIAILIKLMLELLPKKLQQVSSKLLPFTADLQRLRRIRNELIGHRPAATITKKEFDYYWEMISIILKRILPKDQSMEELDKRMENCKTGTVSDADVQKMLEKFAKLSSLITQAEALGEKKKEFQLFFKRAPEKYVRYVKLLFDGGKHVLLGVLYREMNKDNATFDRLIRTNLDKLPGIIKEILLPSTSIEPSSLDISELAEVILNLFGDRISQKDNKHIQTIKDARINYADFARLSLDESKFLSVWTRLVSSISILTTDIDKSLNDKCMEMIEKCTDETLDVTSVDEYLDQLQLETGCVKIKKLKEVYEDMLSELKSLLEEMIDENLFFKEPKELELLVNIDCNNLEIKRKVEENLQADIQTAVQTISIGGVNEQPSEIESLIQNFTANEDVTITTVSRKCILIVLQFSTCGAMKNVIQFVKSAAFQFHIEPVSRMLCLEYGEPISIQANLTLESINNLNNQITQPGDDGYAETHGVKISIGCSSVTGVRHVSEVLKQEKITNTLNELAGTLSDHFGETIALRSVPDFKEWNDIFNDKDLVTSDSSTSNEDDSSEDRFDKKPKERTRFLFNIGMAHQHHLENEKYRQWVKAGLGLGYLKEGLAPFCDDVAKQQHKDILDNIKQTKHLHTVTCGLCALRTLKPDHVKIGNNQCPLGQVNCNCCYTNGKIACPNNVCGAIYDKIITNHASTPPAPYWKNTQTQQWTGDPWSIAKCFINAPGYDQKTSAADIDCTGLLHVIINNAYFHNHIQCNLAVFSKVRQYRNEIFHSSTMELEQADANIYIDDMIAVLQDGKELINRKDAQDAVKKLEELKNEDFIVTTENMERVLRDVREEMGNLRKLTEGLATKDACEDLKRKLSALECLMSEQSEEVKRLKIDDSAHKEQSEYEKSKLDLQKKLIKHYREHILRMSALPLQQEGNLCDFKDVYIRPRMTIQSKSNNKTEEADVLSMSSIFTKDGKTIKSIYVLGEAGSGKTSFCKSLVNFWCLAHSDEGKNIDDAFSGVKEMKKFNFLFYLPLRHYTDKMRIKEMLEGKYEHFALKKLLECESQNCLIVLDGLDEWASPASRCPPERGAVNEYTVLTTSRPWKISTLEITDNEIRQKITLKGFDDETSIKNMIEKTVPILNKKFERDRVLSDCQMALENAPVSVTYTAIILQQLICLWFDDKLHGGTSRCALYTEMLELFFDWHMKKHPDDPLFIEMMKKSDLKNVELPDYLKNTEVCNSYSYIIHDVSRLAYETLFNNTRETSLSFDSSTFKRLKISKEVKSCCLKLGILSEDKCMSFSAGKSRRSVIEFVHKSFQEYLAAVYIAIRYKEHTAPSADSGNPDLSDHCALLIRDFFSKCTTLDGILEQADVIIMLCGLEPRIAVSISKYIYDIVTRDTRVLQYRRTICKFVQDRLIYIIQRCLTDCMDEVEACGIQSSLYLGDYYLQYDWVYDLLCKNFEMQSFSPDSITSIAIFPDETGKYLKRILKYLPKCQRLEAVYIDMHANDDEDNKYVCDVIENNILTLRALSVECSEQLYRIVSRLPDMRHLVALKIGYVTMPHEDVISLCTFLSGSSHLEQISILETKCKPSTDSVCSGYGTVFDECINQHEVDLSKHQHCQYLEYDDSVTVTRVNTSNLETFKHSSGKNTNYVKALDNLSKAYTLTELYLTYDDSVGHIDSYHTVTDKLITLLPLLHQLRQLILRDFTLPDNILKFPSEMKSMTRIDLESVQMSLKTWQQFVDSLPLMPLPVEVAAVGMLITRDGEECNSSIEPGDGEASARQYVRKNEALFNVKFDNEEKSRSFIFISVKK